MNQHVDLNFRAINYSAEVYLNGHKRVLGKGMFRRHSLDVTDILSPVGQNLLAVIVHPPDHPGRIPPTGGQGGDHEVSNIFLEFCNFFNHLNIEPWINSQYYHRLRCWVVGHFHPAPQDGTGFEPISGGSNFSLPDGTKQVVLAARGTNFVSKSD